MYTCFCSALLCNAKDNIFLGKPSTCESRIEPEIRHRPILEDPGEQIKSFWGYQLQSALSRLFRNRLHWNFVWKRVGHASVPWKLQKRQQHNSGAPELRGKPQSPPTEAQSDRFEQSVPLFMVEWAQGGHSRPKMSLRHPCANIVTALCAQFLSHTRFFFQMC